MVSTDVDEHSPLRSNGDRRQVRSQDRNPVIRVDDAAGNVIETREHKGNFKAW